jgi:predicted amidohydrolase
MTAFRVACIQVNASNDLDANIGAAAALACDARAAGAHLALMPENVSMMEWGRQNVIAKAMPEEAHKALAAFRELARETRLWLHCGSLAVRLDDNQVANRSYFLDPRGDVVAHYDKIHMFDVDLAGGESYRESNQFRPGDHAVVVRTPFAVVGLTICYDLRFPALHRALAQAGASILTSPAAFTVPTGKAHWHTLLRARAIENTCFVVAPAQTGTHADGRQTFGHSLIVDPWGEVLGELGTEPGIVTATLDLARIAETRGMVPSLRHDRVWSPPKLS